MESWFELQTNTALYFLQILGRSMSITQIILIFNFVAYLIADLKVPNLVLTFKYNIDSIDGGQVMMYGDLNLLS